VESTPHGLAHPQPSSTRVRVWSRLRTVPSISTLPAHGCACNAASACPLVPPLYFRVSISPPAVRSIAIAFNSKRSTHGSRTEPVCAGPSVRRQLPSPDSLPAPPEPTGEPVGPTAQLAHFFARYKDRGDSQFPQLSAHLSRRLSLASSISL
jgi:hypothetical protein